MVAACSRPQTVVVYDEQWSSASGPTHYQCAAGYETLCKTYARQAIEGEAEFRKTLAGTFHKVPQCEGVKFIVDLDTTQPPRKREPLISDERNSYWKLRIDYRPNEVFEDFTLGKDEKAPQTAGDGDAKQIMSFVCEISKNNGVIDVW